MTSLFSRFATTMANLPATSVSDPRKDPALLLDRTEHGGRDIQMIYAPFDHVNLQARLVIVGLTPGLQQATNALRAAQSALRNGKTHGEAAAEAKVFASFSGPMRTNLIAMLDSVGVARHLGIASTSSLWEDNAHLAHFTSALRYPVFVDGQNWSGQPDMLQQATMRGWLEAYTGAELAALRNAIFVPLGPKVTSALKHLAERRLIDANRILDGMPHPSGANAERIAYFLGRKPQSQLSAKTNPVTIDAARTSMRARIAGL